jgi:hypothetical protein
MFREFESHDLSADGTCCPYALLQLYRHALAGTAKYSTYNLSLKGSLNFAIYITFGRTKVMSIAKFCIEGTFNKDSFLKKTVNKTQIINIMLKNSRLKNFSFTFTKYIYSAFI